MNVLSLESLIIPLYNDVSFVMHAIMQRAVLQNMQQGMLQNFHLFWGWIEFEWWCLSLTSPDSRNFARNLDMVLALTPNRAATSFWGTPAWAPSLGPLGDSISVASLLLQTLFKANFIFQTKGDNVIQTHYTIDALSPGHYSKEMETFCNISLLTLPYIQVYCTFLVVHEARWPQ